MKNIYYTILLICNFQMISNAQTWEFVGGENFISTGPYLSMEIDNKIQYVAVRNPKVNVRMYDPTTATGWSTVGNADLSASIGSYVSLGFENNIPYVAYADAAIGDKATLMKLDGNIWNPVGVAGFSIGEARYTDVAFIGATPYVVYKEVSMFPSDLVVKQFNGTVWVNVGNPGFSAGETSYSEIEIAGGEPYVVYKDFFNFSKVSLKKFNGTVWQTVGIEGFSAGGVHFTQLAFDDITPYVAYRDEANGGKATVMKFDNGSWITVGIVGFSPTDISGIDLRIHGGEPYVIFSSSDSDSKASVMKYDGSNWVYIGVDNFTTSDAVNVELGFINDFPVAAFSGTSVMQLCSPLNTNTSLTGTTLTADEIEATSYQWGLCNQGELSSIINGETNQSFTPQFIPNTFAIIINQYGCIDTSSCQNVVVNSINENNPKIFETYPNPTNGNLTISLEDFQNVISINLYSVSGQLIYQNNNPNNSILNVLIDGNSGLYFLYVEDKSGVVSVQKVIRQ